MDLLFSVYVRRRDRVKFPKGTVVEYPVTMISVMADTMETARKRAELLGYEVIGVEEELDIPKRD